MAELSPEALSLARRVAALRAESESARTAWIKANYPHSLRVELDDIHLKLKEEAQLLGLLVADELLRLANAQEPRPEPEE